MPMITVSSSAEASRPKAHLDHLRGLVADLTALTAGTHPGRLRLVAAPILTDWRVSLYPVPCFVGVFGRQPGLIEGRMGWTADLTLHGEEAGYARTLSRLFRLGTPSGEARS